MSTRRTILIVSADDLIWEPITADLKDIGWSVELIHEAHPGATRSQSDDVSCAVVSDGDLGDCVRDFLASFGVMPPIPVVAVVRDSDVSTTVDAMRLGAFTVIENKGDNVHNAVLGAIERAVPLGGAPIKGDPRDLLIRSHDSPLNTMLDVIPQIAKSDAPVLVTGESGTGKELFARTIHNLSPRADGPFIPVNCAAIPDQLLESELFGYVKGAFTGAHADRDGQFQAADGGTIFLDEIGEMPLQMQVKLLRVLQDKMVTPVGSTKPKAVDFRVVAATNRNLENEVKEGTFREDLFYRLSVLPMHIPPLRERPTDIPVLIDAFMAEQNRVNQTQLSGVTRETLKVMQNYEWPGNVRELQNIMERVAILKRVGFVELEDLPERFFGDHPPPPQMGLYVPSEGMDMAEALSKLETNLLKQALQKADGNKAQAARLLGLNRTTLVEKVKRLKLDED